jgi:ubiquinone/menaquinone biosynthesis C-methylase UbiE
LSGALTGRVRCLARNKKRTDDWFKKRPLLNSARRACIMRETANNWLTYWNEETIFTDADWRKNMEIFVRATDPMMNYTTDDIILDIGCGPGYLASFLKDRVKEIHGVDTSERYLEICGKKFAQDHNVFFYKLDNDNYTDLSFLRTKKFSIIICLSVIQYYKSITDVEKLIEAVRGIALPGSRFLITDFQTNTGTFSDVYGILKTGFKERFLCKALLFLFRARTSKYYKIRSSLGLLTLSVENLNELIDKLHLNAQILSMKLTVNENRKHLLITF